MSTFMDEILVSMEKKRKILNMAYTAVIYIFLALIFILIGSLNLKTNCPGSSYIYCHQTNFCVKIVNSTEPLFQAGSSLNRPCPENFFRCYKDCVGPYPILEPSTVNDGFLSMIVIGSVIFFGGVLGSVIQYRS
jgi:hypothetical protein